MVSDQVTALQPRAATNREHGKSGSSGADAIEDQNCQMKGLTGIRLSAASFRPRELPKYNDEVISKFDLDGFSYANQVGNVNFQLEISVIAFQFSISLS